MNKPEIIAPASRTTEASGRGPVRTAEQGAAAEVRPRPRVCVIDPDPELAHDLSGVLAAMGYEVLTLDKVIGASNLVREFAPDLLIVDVLMPAVSGGELIELLRTNLHAMPVLILHSPLAGPELARLAHDHRADDFVVKSSDLLRLLSRVRFRLRLLGPQPAGVAAADLPVRQRFHKGRGQGS